MRSLKWLVAGLSAALLVASAPTAADAQTPQKLRFQASFPASS